jgi:hypothetical protein
MSMTDDEAEDFAADREQQAAVDAEYEQSDDARRIREEVAQEWQDDAPAEARIDVAADAIEQRIALCDSRLHYRGNVVAPGIVGQVVGPSTVGEWFVILRAEYDPETGLTTAHCGYATPADIEAAAR